MNLPSTVMRLGQAGVSVRVNSNAEYKVLLDNEDILVHRQGDVIRGRVKRVTEENPAHLTYHALKKLRNLDKTIYDSPDPDDYDSVDAYESAVVEAVTKATNYQSEFIRKNELGEYTRFRMILIHFLMLGLPIILIALAIYFIF